MRWSFSSVQLLESGDDYRRPSRPIGRTYPRSKIPVIRSRRNLQKRDGENAGSCRNAPEVIGTWKQYSGRKISGFFPVISDQFLAGKHRKVIGMHRKKIQKISGPNTASMFRCIPAGTVPYSLTWDASQDDHSGRRILQESAGKSRGNRRFPQENSGNQRKTEAVFQPKIVSDFFQMISGRFLPE